METRKREEGKEGKKRETIDPKLTIFSQRQLPLMVFSVSFFLFFFLFFLFSFFFFLSFFLSLFIYYKLCGVFTTFI